MVESRWLQTKVVTIGISSIEEGRPVVIRASRRRQAKKVRRASSLLRAERSNAQSTASLFLPEREDQTERQMTVSSKCKITDAVQCEGWVQWSTARSYTKEMAASSLPANRNILSKRSAARQSDVVQSEWL